ARSLGAPAREPRGASLRPAAAALSPPPGTVHRANADSVPARERRRNRVARADAAQPARALAGPAPRALWRRQRGSRRALRSAAPQAEGGAAPRQRDALPALPVPG